MSNGLKPGDLVSLKSGSPKMTLSKVDGNYAVCDWFEGTKPMSATFPLTSIEPYKSASERSAR